MEKRLKNIPAEKLHTENNTNGSTTCKQQEHGRADVCVPHWSCSATLMDQKKREPRKI